MDVTELYITRKAGHTSPPNKSDPPMKYDYNGTKAPSIYTVWTDELKAKYPYAAVHSGNILWLCDSPWWGEHVESDGAMRFCFRPIQKSEGDDSRYAFCAYHLSDDGNSWVYDQSSDNTEATSLTFKTTELIMVWFSHSVYNQDGMNSGDILIDYKIESQLAINTIESYLTDTVYDLYTDPETIVASTAPDANGQYSVMYDPTVTGQRSAYHELVAWCRTESDQKITVDQIITTPDGSTCLSPNTPIEMSDGTTKTIDELQVGDFVISQHGTPTRVYHISRGYFNDHHTLYTFEDGSVVDETSDHRFFNVEQGFWQFLKYWKIGEHAIKSNGETVALVSVERIDEEAEKCGVWTDDGSYYANGFLTGTATNNKPLLATATAEQAVDMMMSVEEYRLLQLLNIGGVLP